MHTKGDFNLFVNAYRHLLLTLSINKTLIKLMKKLLLISLCVIFSAGVINSQQRSLRSRGSQPKAKMELLKKAPLLADEQVNEEYLAYTSEDVASVGIWDGENSVAAYFPADVVKRLIGNKLVGIATQIQDENASDLCVWVSRSLDEEPFIKVDVAEGFPIGQPIRINFQEPYELVEEGLYIGYTFTCNDPNTASIACDWTDRDNALLYKAPDIEWQDWSHTYNGSLYILGITEGDKMFANEDVVILNATSNRAFTSNYSEHNLNLYNYGKLPINSIDIDYTINDETTSINIPFDWAIYQFESTGIVMNIETPSEEGRYDVSFKITKVNGNSNADNGANTRDAYTICVEEGFPRTVFIEQTENTTDEWSSVSNLVMEEINTKYTDVAIGVAVHQNFPNWDNGELTCDSYLPITKYVNQPYSEFVNRKYIDYAFETYYDEYDPQSAFRLGNLINLLNTTATEGKIELKAAYTDESKSEIVFESQTTFAYNSNSEVPYSVAYILVEKEVEGFTMLNRYNYDFMLDELFWGDTYEMDYYWETTPPELKELGEIPYENIDIPYLNVARGIYDCFGIEGSLAGNIVKNEVKTHNYTIDVPETVIDSNNLYAVAILIDAYNGEVINAVKCNITDKASLNSINYNNVNVHTEGNKIIVEAIDADAEIYALNGNKLAETHVDGKAEFTVDETMVIVRVVSGSDVTVKRLVVK